MDIDSPMETLLDSVFQFLPDKADLGMRLFQLQDFSPAELPFLSVMKFLMIFAACSLLMSMLGRVVLGRRSSLNHSLSSAMGILFIYVITIVIYTFKPWHLEQFLSPLPFIVFAQDMFLVIPFQGGILSVICHELLSLIILAFLVNLLDSLLPRGRSIITWYFLRLVTVGLAMGLHLLVDWTFDTYLPDALVSYAPVILLGILVSMLFLGLLNIILGALLAIVDPIIGAIYTFFFSNIIGKQITKAVFTAAVICAIIFLFGFFGFTIISITNEALVSYIPVVFVMLILWYIIGHLL